MKRSILKQIVSFVFLVMFSCFVGKGWYLYKDGFSMQRIRFDLTQGGENEYLDPIVKASLLQKFSYLGRGRQCYAFASEDGRYVLKLPRADIYRLPFWLRSCSFPLLDSVRKASLLDKKNRFLFLMNSFSLASKELKKETAILYSHLSSTNHLQSTILLEDRIGRIYPFDLDKSVFILQEKKSLMIPIFKEHLKNRNQKESKKLLEAFIHLMADRSKKGIENKDASFLRNFGYDGNSVTQIDIGSFYRSQKQFSDFSFSFQDSTNPVSKWLGTINLDLQSWFDKRVLEVIQKEK